MIASSWATLLFFWDYDTQWGADRSRGPGGPKDWGHLDFTNTERLLELHEEYEVPACFAVVGAAALPGPRPYHDPDQIRRIGRAGHEIASHGFQHDWLPGLSRQQLLQTLRQSKQALEECTGSEVVSFVPPYNQPFDYAAGWSISLSERREAGPERTDLRGLCEGLRDSGYRFCRIAYRSLSERAAQFLSGRDVHRAKGLETIREVTCARIGGSGFDARSTAWLHRAAHWGGLVVVYGHPHSLDSGNSQNERFLIPFLEEVCRLRREQRLRVCLPRELLRA